MNNNTFCPISYKKIDEHVARLNGFFTVILLSVYVLTGSLLPLLVLAYDFLVRSIEKPQYSLLAILSKRLLALIPLKPLLINAGPKIFAARIGLLFTVFILFFQIIGAPVAALVFTAIFGLCAFLEAAIGFCVACKLYPFFYKLIYQTDYKRMKFKSDWQI